MVIIMTIILEIVNIHNVHTDDYNYRIMKFHLQKGFSLFNGISTFVGYSMPVILVEKL